MASYDLVGGVSKIVIHPTSTSLPDLGSSDSGYDVDLELNGYASYSEQTTCEDGQYAVLHRVSYVSEYDNSPLTKIQLERAMNEGIVCDVSLNAGETIRVGWSEKFGVACPLRLVKSEYLSGASLTDYPLKSWVWESTDLETLIE